MTERTCGNCRWWDRRSGEATGDCQRHPPLYNDAWARTDEVDFCGEWADKNITPEQEERREIVRRFAVAIVQGQFANDDYREDPRKIWSRAQQYADAEPESGGTK